MWRFIKAAPAKYRASYESVIKRVRNGITPKEAIRRSSVGGEILHSFGELFAGSKKEDGAEINRVDDETLHAFEEKMQSPLAITNIRIAASAHDASRAEQILSDIEATFNQFEQQIGVGLWYDF